MKNNNNSNININKLHFLSIFSLKKIVNHNFRTGNSYVLLCDTFYTDECYTCNIACCNVATANL